MISNSGKQLEQFVKQIESLLIPQGFNIESRKRVYNDAGIQVAELDIVITGKVGSATYKMLFECRDRQSEGPAPASWIEQMVGRRTRLKFDKVIAVSTTGFTVGAIAFANESSIELRSVDTLTLDDVATWFRFQVYACCGVLNHVDFGVLNDDALEAFNDFLPKTSSIDCKSFMVVHSKTRENVTIAAIWDKVFKENKAEFNNMRAGDAKQVIISANYDDPNDKYQLETSTGLFSIDKMIFTAEFSVKCVQPSLIAEYAYNKGNSIAQTVCFSIDTGAGLVELNWYNLRV